MIATPGFLGPIGIWEMLIIGGIALLIFGSRLPSTMRSLGQSVVSFKKGLREAEDEDAAEQAGKKKPLEGGDGSGEKKS